MKIKQDNKIQQTLCSQITALTSMPSHLSDNKVTKACFPVPIKAVQDHAERKKKILIAYTLTQL